MGAMTAIMLGLGAASAIQQFSAGSQQKTEAEYNATQVTKEAQYNAGVYRQQAGMIEDQKNLQAMQDDRAIRFAAGKHVAITAAKGIELSGSAMAVLADTMTQMEMDKAIGQYNFEMQKYTALSQAESITRKGDTVAGQYRRSGATAYTAGVTGGLTTLFNTAAYVGMSNVNTSAGAKKAGGA
jgi:hypothetical protein